MSDLFDLDLDISVLQEYAEFTIGKKLGSGMSRDVYQHPYDYKKVIKIENFANHFQNVMEWELWQHFCNCKKISKWLAPCHSISENGTFLIMSKAESIRLSEAPKSMPAFLTDHKLDNLGMIGEQIVCRDYGKIIMDLDLTMKKWWGEREI